MSSAPSTSPSPSFWLPLRCRLLAFLHTGRDPGAGDDHGMAYRAEEDGETGGGVGSDSYRGHTALDDVVPAMVEDGDGLWVVDAACRMADVAVDKGWASHACDCPTNIDIIRDAPMATPLAVIRDGGQNLVALGCSKGFFLSLF